MRTGTVCGLVAVLCVLGVSLAQPARGVSKPEAVRAPAESGWSIVLVTCRGEGQDGEASTALATAKGAGLSDAYAEKRGAATVVAVGRFKDRMNEAAQARLMEIRGLTVEGKRPYTFAFLSPPSEAADLGSHPEHNLLKAKEEYGKQAKYTLQVAAYGRTDGKEPSAQDLADAHKAAEEAVAVLRREGELAFYYHSPTGKKLSMVCIGVWSDDDLYRKGDKANGVPAQSENAELTALRARFRWNLVNGAKCIVKAMGTNGPVETAQTSFLVMIPGN